MGMSRKHTARQPKARTGVSYAQVCELALKLWDVQEGTSYGTPALKVRGKLMARLKEDGETLVLRTTFADRDRLLAAAPDVFYLTDHYVKYPWILVRLPRIDHPLLLELIAEAWRLAAPLNASPKRKRGKSI